MRRAILQGAATAAIVGAWLSAWPQAAAETVYYGETAAIRGFDPAMAADIPTLNAVAKIYEGLYQYAYLARPYRVEPNLAAELPVVSADGLVLTVRLRPGIYFADDPCFTKTGGAGRELSAADFIYAIQRVADLRNRSTGYWLFTGRIEGLDEFRQASAQWPAGAAYPPVAGLQALDHYTLRIRLRQPWPQAIWAFTMPYAFAVAREAVACYGSEFVKHPVGTGPYALRAWRPNYRLEFARNPAWARHGRIERYPAAGTPEDRTQGLLADAGRPIPFIDRIVQHVIGDPSTQWLMFLSGRLESSGISRDNWDAVMLPTSALSAELAARGIRLTAAPALDTYYIGFNMDDPVVGTNRPLRQALACAFDADEWVRFYGQRVVRANGPLPPGIAGYEERATPFPYDPARTAALLAQAGYPGGRDAARGGRRLELTLELGSTDAETREAVELFTDFLARVGVRLSASYNNKPVFFGKIERRQAQMFWLNWMADYPDAENFLQLFYGPNGSPGPNRANYRNPEFDRLYEQARSMTDGAERAALCRAMAALVTEDCPWIFLHHPKSVSLQQAWLKNVKPHDFSYGMLKYYRIDLHEREQAAR